jgi:anthranilate phosphoribosyltransferase
VNSLDGYDEISLTSEFKCFDNNGETIYTPEQLGFKRAEENALYGGATIGEAAAIFDRVLENQATEEQKNAVVVNAAFAIKTINPKFSIAECIDMARESLDSGKALNVFRKFVKINSV